MTAITKTRLYLRLAPCIRKEDHPILRRELARAFKTAEEWHNKGDATRLDEAFIWNDSPQGHDFWAELSARLSAAGYGDVS